MTTRRGHCGTVICEGVEACITVGGEDLVVTGGIILPPVLEQGRYLDAWVDGVRLDVPGGNGPAWSGALTNIDEDRAHDALYEAAVEEVRSR